MKRMLLALAGVVVLEIFFRQAHRETPPVPEAAAPTNHHSLISPHFAASARAQPAPVQEAQTNRNSILRYLKGEEVPKLNDAQLEPFLDASRRSAGSLLAALRASSDAKYLREAMQKYPNDPRVNYAAFFSGDLTAEEKQQALASLKQSDPNNALGDYLTAAGDLKSGQPAQALQEMADAAKRPGWQDYTLDFMQNAEEAYVAAGYSQSEAKSIAASSVLLPDVSPLKGLGEGLSDLAKSFQQSGDTASAQSALQSAMNLGQQVSSSAKEPPITTLVGIAIQFAALNGGSFRALRRQRPNSAR
jgi:hypothetical protein